MPSHTQLPQTDPRLPNGSSLMKLINIIGLSNAFHGQFAVEFLSLFQPLGISDISVSHDIFDNQEWIYCHGHDLNLFQAHQVAGSHSCYRVAVVMLDHKH
jgi:hypothetical protein